MLTFAAVANAQTADSKQQTANQQNPLPAAAVKERLSDDTFIVVIDGNAYKAFSVVAVREILKTREELDKETRARVKLEDQIAFYEKNQGEFTTLVQTADTQRDEEAALKRNFMTLYEGEHKLRLDSEKLRGSPGTVNKWLNNPVVRLAKEVGLPLAQTWLTARIQNNTTMVMNGQQLAMLQSQQRGQPRFVLKI